ncbi:hypothetical protein DMN91_003592 [Ooceraea biroi]|uniref:E3 ubiquitin-protein ligase FANCL n=1 Tax=Ooceraea biroi TaxID=2015173 RepID=A0A026X2C6_OOCBI|nr:E3 ubiquitin-protein ligase FANCL [Ooceraea biroi]XP_011335536.1 E3 ubiquitin-protein ligase FANCL [Ooceraea biroi]EZA62218.1 E3 ubiquitin-protein ligase FANCL [Ooceraea biroi]RLU23388.1 hypothetical protein DMN91_003592 [Ooceraea biroi]
MATKVNDYETVLEYHPEMILTSESPVTWQGFLIISKLYAAREIHCPRVKLKLVVPNYPSLGNMQIRFGRQIVFLRNREFSRKVKQLMNDSQTVSSFLTQLQLLIGKYMCNMNDQAFSTDYESINDFLQDLKAALQNPSGVQLSSDQSLSVVKLSLRGVSLTLQRCNNIKPPWKVVFSDLPKIPAFEGFEKNVTNLTVTITKFKWGVELLEKAWEQLKEIDRNCWVIGPLEPKRSHMYRRIHLSQSLSVTVTIDPLNPTALPGIQFLGSDNEVKKQKDDVSNNIHNWNENCSVLKNLRILLNMYDFPEQQQSLEDEEAIIGSRECGICFFTKSDTDELPDKICNNERCMKHFHSVCLARWLQTKAGNLIVFGYIHGTCPHCKEHISCSIRQ